MHPKIIARIFGVIASTLTAAACQYSPDMADRSLAYNRAVATSTDQLLLLNIVRSAQRLPTHYSRLEGDTAALGVTPSIGLSQPFGHARTLETDIAAGVAATKDTAALAAISSMLGLQGADSNTLNLQSLDDQKYQIGAMSPVPLKYFKIFLDEGYQPDLLAHLFVSRIRIKKEFVAPKANYPDHKAYNGEAPLDAAAHERCDQLTDQPPEIYLAQVCDVRPELAPISLANCIPRKADHESSIVTIDFVNDPAHIIGATDNKEQSCFERIMLDLIISGISVGKKSEETYKFIDGPIGDDLASDPRFRAQVVQQGYTLLRATPNDGVQPHADSPRMWVVCQKQDDDSNFTVTFPSPTDSAKKEPVRRAPRHVRHHAVAGAPLPPAAAAPTPAVGPLESLQNAIVKQPTPAAGEDEDSESPELTADDYQHKCLADGKTRRMNAKGGSPLGQFLLDEKKIEFTSRSFEAMVYYLGEIARTFIEYERSSHPPPQPAIVKIIGRNPTVTGSRYWDTMFVVSTRLRAADLAISVPDDEAGLLNDGIVAAIPKPCITMQAHVNSKTENEDEYSSRPLDACSLEYPDNESLSVLTLLNQIWGLQKEQTATPPPAVIVTP